MKKALALLLSLCLVFLQIPLATQAAEAATSGECGYDQDILTWQFTDDGTLTISGEGEMTDYAVSGEYAPPWSGLAVKKVVIEEGVTFIGAQAFLGLKNLETVIIADSVNYIGARAFADCDKLVNVTMGTGLILADVELFAQCDSLASFTFPDTDALYGGGMFYSCDSLSNVVIPESMLLISEAMFQNCRNLEQITLPNSILAIGANAFNNCALKEIIIPEMVTGLENETFAYCRFLQSVTLPDGLQFMGTDVFEYCDSLKTITIPASVTRVLHTFEQAYHLESVTFLGNAPVASNNLFGHITVTVYYPENNPSWTETVRQNYGGTVTWVPYESDLEVNEVIASGTCGESVSWELANTWTLTVSGEGPMQFDSEDAPWQDYTSRIEHIIIEPGVTSVAKNAFRGCAVTKSISIADTVVSLEDYAFSGCGDVTELVIPASVRQIGRSAVGEMNDLETIRFLGDAPDIHDIAFYYTEACAIYPENNATWTEDKLYGYSGTLTWWDSGHVHDYKQITIDATCNDDGRIENYCEVCGHLVILSYIECLGHDYPDVPCGEAPICTREGCNYQGSTVGHKWDDPCSSIRHCVKCGTEDTNGGHSWDGKGIRACRVCGIMDGGYRLYLDIGTNQVFIDGQAYVVRYGNNGGYIDLPTNTATSLVTYTYNAEYVNDKHKQYPTGMKVWRLTCEGDYYTATYVPEFDNLLQYAGSSIRITGTKGIRMITAIDKSKKDALTGKGLAGYKLVEYGTTLCWEKDLAGGEPMVLGKDHVKSNYAYKRGVADPVFAKTKDTVQYTNVLVGFTLNQCKDDIAMRPYIILEDKDGTRVTIYGGIVYRSIGYIAYQNRSVFQSGTSSYNYVWEIIHHVYGNKYDAEFKG